MRARTSAVGVVVEPGPDDERPELGLHAEAEGCVEPLGIVGLESHVLARHRIEEQAHQR